MTMSDWQVFIAVVSPLVCAGRLFPNAVMEMWAPLQRALLYFTRYNHGQQVEECIVEAQNDLLAYASMVEDTFKLHRLATHQLHAAVVHLADMVRAYGPSAFRAEFWVERMMQLMKRVTKYRTSCSPELVAVHAWLVRAALLHLEATDPGVTDLLQRIDPRAKADDPQGRDEFDSQGNLLTGKLSDMEPDLVCLNLIFALFT